MNATRITATFLDEISHDIPHQNWGPQEWDADFAHMKAVGINTVVLIRSGYRRFATFDSQVLSDRVDIHKPPADLVGLFLQLAEKHGLQFYFGLYDSGLFWDTGRYGDETEINTELIDEVWQRYGGSSAFAGWYLSQEVSQRNAEVTDVLTQLGNKAKAVSGGLPVMISPYIEGKKAVLASNAALTKESSITLEQHEEDWNHILRAIKGAVDIVAFQDGHVDFDELPDFLQLNKSLADKYGMESWTNSETFDRDMPIKFLPIKWEKLLLKLRAAHDAGIHKAITFEFSHFMSPQSAYLQAGHLYRRYSEYFF